MGTPDWLSMDGEEMMPTARDDLQLLCKHEFKLLTYSLPEFELGGEVVSAGQGCLICQRCGWVEPG